MRMWCQNYDDVMPYYDVMPYDDVMCGVMFTHKLTVFFYPYFLCGSSGVFMLGVK